MESRAASIDGVQQAPFQFSLRTLIVVVTVAAAGAAVWPWGRNADDQVALAICAAVLVGQGGLAVSAYARWQQCRRRAGSRTEGRRDAFVTAMVVSAIPGATFAAWLGAILVPAMTGIEPSIGFFISLFDIELCLALPVFVFVAELPLRPIKSRLMLLQCLNIVSSLLGLFSAMVIAGAGC